MLPVSEGLLCFLFETDTKSNIASVFQTGWLQYGMGLRDVFIVAVTSAVVMCHVEQLKFILFSR